MNKKETGVAGWSNQMPTDDSGIKRRQGDRFLRGAAGCRGIQMFPKGTG
jgi:hypothetical protein